MKHVALTNYWGGEELESARREIVDAGIAVEWHDMAGGFVWLIAYREDGSCVTTDNGFATDDLPMGVCEYHADHDPLMDCYEPDGVVDTATDGDTLAGLFIRVYRGE